MEQPDQRMVELDKAAAYVRSRLGLSGDAAAAQVGVVLGSGLGAWADTLDDKLVIPYGEVPHMPQSAVVGHAGNLVLGAHAGVRVACLAGRVHAYEGHPPARVVFGARLLARLGCGAVLLTNAAGGIRAGFAPGDLMLISDHLNLMGQSPLVGPNLSELGTRFPDMTEAYAPRLRAMAREAAQAAGVRLHEGVYAALLGPSYETPAEIRMLRAMGADAVGMSTVLETVAARHMGARVLGVSCITNKGAGLSQTALDHSEVQETANRVKGRFVSLLRGVLSRIARGEAE